MKERIERTDDIEGDTIRTQIQIIKSSISFWERSRGFHLEANNEEMVRMADGKLAQEHKNLTEMQKAYPEFFI